MKSPRAHGLWRHCFAIPLFILAVFGAPIADTDLGHRGQPVSQTAVMLVMVLLPVLLVSMIR